MRSPWYHICGHQLTELANEAKWQAFIDRKPGQEDRCPGCNKQIFPMDLGKLITERKPPVILNDDLSKDVIKYFLANQDNSAKDLANRFNTTPYRVGQILTQYLESETRL